MEINTEAETENHNLSLFNKNKKFQTLPNGEELCYYDFQNKSSPNQLIFLHGHLCSSKVFTNMLPVLAQKHSCIAIDMRGFGNSKQKNVLDKLEDLAEDIYLFLMEKKIHKCILVGSSLGGAICQLIAIYHPFLVQALICLSPMPPTGFPIYRFLNKKPILQRILSKEELQGHPQIEYIEKILKEKNVKKMKEIYKKSNFPNDCPSEQLLETLSIEALQQQNHKQLRWAGNVFNISHLNNTYCMGNKEIFNLKCKMLIIQGGNDQTVEPRFSQLLADFLPNCNIQIVNETGHLFFVESERAQKETINHIQLFLDQQNVHL